MTKYRLRWTTVSGGHQAPSSEGLPAEAEGKNEEAAIQAALSSITATQRARFNCVIEQEVTA